MRRGVKKGKKGKKAGKGLRMKKDDRVMVNFRCDPTTLAALDRLAAAFQIPGSLTTGGRSQAIRAAILAAAAKLDAEKADE